MTERKFLDIIFLIIFAVMTAVVVWLVFSTLKFGQSNCGAVEYGEKWLSTSVENEFQLRQEINELLVDNHCDGITAEKLRKVLFDMRKVK